MALTLHRLLRQLKLSANRTISSQSYAPKSNPDAYKLAGVEFAPKLNSGEDSLQSLMVKLSPRILNRESNNLSIGTSISSKIIKCPVLTNLEIIEPPKSLGIENVEDFPIRDLQLPSPSENIVEKQAARLIVIRKKKMKKHKLRKLRKRMKFEWAKVRQKREMRKEKAFQAELLAQIREAEQFDATNYVAEKIRKATEVPIPKFWKGKRLPEFIIRQKLGLDPVEKK